MSKLDQILADRMWFIEQEINSGQNVKDVLHNFKDELEDKIKQLFQELLDEVIGEDEPLPFDDRDWDRVQHENQMKAIQRQRAKELLEEL